VGGIFISYRREDSPWCAGRLKDRLCGVFEPDTIFMDVESIDGGEKYRSRIARGILESDIVLVLIGRRWMGTDAATGKSRIGDAEDFVRREVADALYQGKDVIPVLVDDATLPARADLPENIARIVDLQAEHLRYMDFHTDVDGLIRLLEPKATRRLAPATAPTEPPTRLRLPVGRPTTVALAGLATLAVAAVGFWITTAGQEPISAEEQKTELETQGYRRAKGELLNNIEGVVQDDQGVPITGASVQAKVTTGNKTRATEAMRTVQGGIYALDIATLEPQPKDAVEVFVTADQGRGEASFLYEAGLKRIIVLKK
jgi:hypothetical protein